MKTPQNKEFRVGERIVLCFKDRDLLAWVLAIGTEELILAGDYVMDIDPAKGTMEVFADVFHVPYSKSKYK